MPKNIKDVIDAVVGVMPIEDLIDQTPGPVQPVEKDPSTDTVKAIVTKLQHPEWWNGYLGISRLEDVSTSTVHLVVQAVIERLAELAEA